MGMHKVSDDTRPDGGPAECRHPRRSTDAPDAPGVGRRSRGGMRRRASVAAAIGVVAVLGLGACAGGSRTSSDQAAPATEANAAGNKALGAPTAGGSGAGAGADTPAGQPATFLVDAYDETAAPSAVGSFISTATITVKVDDVAAAKPKVVAVAQAAGGGLFGEETSFGAKSTSVITLKVPPEKFTALLHDLGALGTLESEQVKTDDVTQQAVDLDARIAAAGSSLERTRALLDKASSLSEITQLENEVSRRQADFESLKGQQRALQGKVALATIVVTLSGDQDATPAELQKKAEEEAKKNAAAAPLPGFTDGFSGGLKVAGNIGTVALAAIGALIPFLPLVILMVVAVKLLQRLQRRRSVVAGPAVASTGRPGPGTPFPPAP